MNDSNADNLDDAAEDGPVPPDETAIRTMLEQSRRDIAEGRVRPLAPVLDRMRATAHEVRARRARSC
jgi:hypothetical protein